MTVSIGVVFASIEQETQEILSYLITYQNTLQKSFEFRLVSYSVDDDPLLNLLQQKPRPHHDEAAAGGEDFASRVKEFYALQATFEQERLKNLFSFTFQILLAIAAVVIGLKR